MGRTTHYYGDDCIGGHFDNAHADVVDGTVVTSTCVDCGEHVKLVGWIGPRTQESAVYVHVNPVVPDEPELCYKDNPLAWALAQEQSE